MWSTSHWLIQFLDKKLQTNSCIRQFTNILNLEKLEIDRYYLCMKTSTLKKKHTYLLLEFQW